MAENKKKPNLMERRVKGAVAPLNEFNDAELTNSKTVPTASAKSIKKSKANNAKSIKISEETYKDLSVLKNMENINFDYEIIQMLIDQYTEKMTEPEKRRFTVLRENI